MLASSLILAVRLCQIHLFGYALPYSDQWDSEGADLLRPFRLGLGVDWHMIFAPHNEHRIAFARLEALALFTLNDEQWDNLLAAMLNAFFVALAAAFALRAMLRQPLRDRSALAALTFIAFCMPCGYENLLIGFQLQIFLLVALAVLGAWLIASHRPGLRLAALCALVAAGSLFSVASGLFTAVALLVGLLLRRWAARDPWPAYVAPLLVCAAAAATGYLLLIPVPGHASLHAQNLREWFNAVCILGSWPLPGHWPFFALTWSPTLLAGATLLRRRELRPTDVAGLTLALWTALQIAGIAYGRARELAPIASRYTDVLALTVLVNAYFCASLWRGAGPARTPSLAAGVAVWLVVVLGAYAVRGAVGTYAMYEFGASRAHQTAHVRDYVVRHDTGVLRRAEPWNVPYPDVSRLQRLLDDATLRDILPADVREPLSLGNFHGGFERERPMDASVRGSTYAVSAETAAHLIRAPQRIDALHSRMSYLKIPVMGRLGDSGIDLRLQSVTGTESRRVIRSRDYQAPRDVYLPVPGREFALLVQHPDTQAEFAVGAPVEVGRLSRFATWLLEISPYMMLASVILAALAYRRIRIRDIVDTLLSGDAVDLRAQPRA